MQGMMSINPTSTAALSPAPRAAAAPSAAPKPRAAAAPPDITGGITLVGEHPRFRQFSAQATGGAYGAANGYDTLREAVDALTMVTVGARQPAAGIFEVDGRFHARRMDNSVTFSTGAIWKGTWRLEQFPADLDLIGPAAAGSGAQRSEALKAIVDGAQRIDVTHLPVG